MKAEVVVVALVTCPIIMQGNSVSCCVETSRLECLVKSGHHKMSWELNCSRVTPKFPHKAVLEV